MNEFVKIFVEGEADNKFIQDLLFHLKISFKSTHIIPLGGKFFDTFVKVEPQFFRNQNEKNLIIVDSDDNNLSRYSSEIKQKLSKYQSQTEVFLLPNNIDPGELEDLLFSILNLGDNQVNRQILVCFENYTKCITSPPFKKPGKEDKLFAFINAQLSNQERGQRGNFTSVNKRNYNDTRFWNLDNEELLNLKKFLSKHLS